MKKRMMLLSMVSIVFTLISIIGISYALFTDSVEFTNNYIKTTTVSIEASCDEIKLENAEDIGTQSYTINVTNYSTTTIATRIIFDVEGDLDLLPYITFEVDNEVIQFDESRGVSSWNHGIEKGVNPTYTLEITVSNSLPQEMNSKQLNFVYRVDAVQDNFVKVSSNAELSNVLDGEYVILTNFTDTEINITKNIYLDLGTYTLDKVTIDGKDITTVELVNGTIKELYINASNTTVYCYAEVTSKIYANVSSNSLYYFAEQSTDSVLTVEVVGGHVSLNTNADLEVTVLKAVDGAKQVVLTVSENTSIQKLEIAEDVDSDVTLDVKGTVEEVVNNSKVEITTDTEEISAHPNALYISENADEEKYITIDGKVYKHTSVLLSDALESDKGIYIFEEGDYYLSETLVIDKDLRMIGLGNVNIIKEHSTAYYEDTLIAIKNSVEVEFNNLTFTDNEYSDIYSCCISVISGENDITVVNCNFNLFQRNSLTFKSSTGLVDNCNFYTESNGTPNAIQIDKNSNVEVSNSTFENYYSETLSATGIFVLRGSNANIYNNTFIDVQEAITISSIYDIGYDESTYDLLNNSFENCNVDVIYKGFAYIVTKDEFNSYYYSYSDDITYYYEVISVHETITSVLDIYNVSYYEDNLKATILIFEGTYNEKTLKANNNPYYNVWIQAPVTLKGIGEVNITTNNKNEIGTAQQTILIQADNVTLDNLNVYTTTGSSNSTDKAIEVRSGSNIVIKNCTLYNSKYETGSDYETVGIYIGGSSIGSYKLLNNTIVNMDTSIHISNGAGNIQTKDSIIANNICTSGISFVGKRNNAYDFKDIDNFPVVYNNSFGLSELGYICFSTRNEDKLVSVDYLLLLIANNNFSNEGEIDSYTSIYGDENNYHLAYK